MHATLRRVIAVTMDDLAGGHPGDWQGAADRVRSPRWIAWPSGATFWLRLPPDGTLRMAVGETWVQPGSSPRRRPIGCRISTLSAGAPLIPVKQATAKRCQGVVHSAPTPYRLYQVSLAERLRVLGC